MTVFEIHHGSFIEQPLLVVNDEGRVALPLYAPKISVSNAFDYEVRCLLSAVSGQFDPKHFNLILGRRPIRRPN